MKLTSPIVQSFDMAKVYKDSTSEINALDFHEKGAYLVTSGEDDCIRLYDCNSGEEKAMRNAKKYGVKLVRFTHSEEAVVCASNNAHDQTIRYWSLHQNTYLRYFKGHQDRVVSMAMSPKDDTFLSGALDDTVRLWDLRSPNCQGLIRRHSRACVAYDPHGLVFGITASANRIKLFDLRNFDQGSFLDIDTKHDQAFDWASMSFSSDGCTILASTTCNAVFLFDAFNGDMVQSFEDRPNDGGLNLEASFSADGRFIASGSETGDVYVWERGRTSLVTKLSGHTSATNVVRWSPTAALLASGCTNLAFWIPTQTSMDQSTD